jgi:hypothetical protein
MILDANLAKELDAILQGVFRALDESAALVRERSDSEAEAYATAVGEVFMCIYHEILDPIYRDHPELAPPSWSMD